MKNDELRAVAEKARKLAPRECVSMTIHITSEGTRLEGDFRTPDDLKRSGISMRNLRGEWITDELMGSD